MKKRIKTLVDLLMTVCLTLLMAYSLIGEQNHEIIGIVMFALFIIHQILNVGWYKGLFKGKYNAVRIIMTIINCVIFCLMLTQMFAGIMMSRYLFKDLTVTSAITAFRAIHLILPYWLYIFSALHLGFHWRMILSVFKKITVPKAVIWIMRSLALMIAAYGVYAMIHRQFFGYMFYKLQFAFFDFNEPLIIFILDYLAVMGLFVFIGYYLLKLLTKKRSKQK